MKLAFTTAGPYSGPTLLLIHGVTNSRRRHTGNLVDWVASRGYRVVNIDLRGHGQSGRAESYLLDDYASDVATLIEDLGSDPSIVVGHSMGGVVAAAVAAARPDLVRAILLEDPALYRPGPGALQDVLTNALRGAAWIRSAQRDGLTPQHVATLVGDMASEYPDSANRDVMTQHDLIQAAHSWLTVDPTAIEAFFRWTTFDEDDRWGLIECPVTILRSDPTLDAHFLPEDVERFTSSVPQANIRLVEGAGHSILLQPDGPDRYLAELDEFLTTLP